MISHHIIYDITCSVLMTSLPLHVTLHPLYLCHHNHSIYDLCQTVCMTSHPLYVWHLMHNALRRIHSLWLHTIVVTILCPLHSQHHTHYIWYHRHDNTNVISIISPLYLTLHPLYLCHQTQCINYTTPTLWMTSHTLYVWHHIQLAGPNRNPV